MINGEGVVTVKGRAACEIDTADELLTTEMMFNGTFNGLDKHQLVALVSCLVPGEKSQVRACPVLPYSPLHSHTHLLISPLTIIGGRSHKMRPHHACSGQMLQKVHADMILGI